MDIPSPEDRKKQEHGVGPMAGIVIVVLVLLLGGIYFLVMDQQKGAEPAPNSEQASL